jgi:hypothetical protein
MRLPPSIRSSGVGITRIVPKQEAGVRVIIHDDSVARASMTKFGKTFSPKMRLRLADWSGRIGLVSDAGFPSPEQLLKV